MKRMISIAAVSIMVLGASMGAVAGTDGSEKDGAAKGGGGVTIVDASGLEYWIETDVTYSTTESASGAASDATYTTPVIASTSLGGTTSSALSDAFDGYNGIGVWAGVAKAGEGPPVTVYNMNGAATLEDGGRTVALNTQTINGVMVRREVFVPENDEFARWLTFITNPGSTDLLGALTTFNNLGSDSGTIIHQTSSSGPPPAKGGVAVSTEDGWVVSYEEFYGADKGGGRSEDPRLGHVFFDVDSIRFEDFDDNPTWTHTFSLPAGETRIVINYVTGQPNLADAVAKAQELSNPSTSAHGLDFMSAQEISQLVNVAAGPTDLPPVIVPFGNASVDDGAAYSDTPTLSQGTAPIAWSITAPATPPGDMAIDAATGEVTWTAEYTASSPTKDVDITIQASGPGGVDTYSWTVVVNALAPVVDPIADVEIANGQAYSATPTLTQGSGATTWALSAPASPPGDMAVNAATGELTWTTDNADSPVSVRVRASGPGGSDTVSWIITVLAAAAPRAGGGGDGGDLCFIATAAYGTPMASEIDALRGVRDTYMLKTAVGSAFVDSYYRFSPPVANFISQYPVLRLAVRVLLAPIVLLSKVFLVSPLAGVLVMLAAGLALTRLYRGVRRIRARA